MKILCALAVTLFLSFSESDSAVPVCSRYPCYPSRAVHHLDGLWDFVFISGVSDPSKFDPSKAQYNDTMVVPGSFDALKSYEGVHGTGVYRRRLSVTPMTMGRLKFESCGFYCAIYVDQKKLGDHKNGYTAFWMDVPPSDSNTREIVVVADNQFSDLVPLHKESYDFYQYGGITRALHFHETPALSIENVDVIVRNASKGEVDVQIRLHSTTKLPDSISVDLQFDTDETPSSHTAEESKGSYTIIARTVQNHKLWSPKSPSMHTLHVVLHDSNDSIVVRFGLRDVQPCKDNKTGSMSICINGEPTKLLGFSKHDTHPTFGMSLPDNQLLFDVQLLRQMGGNYFRLVHYPHNPHLLDMCDELGILLWQETLGWGLSESTLTNPDIQKDLLYELDEMVNNTFNHPSVILWAYLNEGASDHTDSCTIYSKLSQRYKELRVNGLVSWASNRKQNDKCLDAADVLSFNSYPGWYDGGLDSIVPMILGEADFVARKGKPFIKSEIGAGAIPGWQDTVNTYWTVTYQGQVLELVTKTVVSNSTITGVSLWQFYDARTRDGIGRPRAFNNKGTFDEYRRPKIPAYTAVRDAFTSYQSPFDQNREFFTSPTRMLRQH
ncbi:beta-glucuronidase-like [Oscarella lobularis]|uniref:beta-glucuronidase-like n=1 Tax=Oscarella lobularis TaxID=121494 RepID=UPI003313B801